MISILFFTDIDNYLLKFKKGFLQKEKKNKRCCCACSSFLFFFSQADFKRENHQSVYIYSH